IGPATAASLESESRPPDLVAPDSKGEGVLSCLIAALGGEQAIAGLKILIPRAAVAREFLPSELVRLGAKVDIIEVYRTVIPDVSSDDIVKLFQNRKVDVIVFTSSSTVTNLAALIEPADLRSLLKEVAVACIGPVTAATASEKGLRVDIRPDSYTGAALVQAISNYFPA
ncbi:MAG TPA: uroporphyrinogen-III synthase, partial [Blastocatellia bacterium]|nr:uroporphyrinogen-III synthase [Blastocatellia bacterium]